MSDDASDGGRVLVVAPDTVLPQDWKRALAEMGFTGERVDPRDPPELPSNCHGLLLHVSSNDAANVRDWSLAASLAHVGLVSWTDEDEDSDDDEVGGIVSMITPEQGFDTALAHLPRAIAAGSALGHKEPPRPKPQPKTFTDLLRRRFRLARYQQQDQRARTWGPSYGEHLAALIPLLSSGETHRKSTPLELVSCVLSARLTYFYIASRYSPESTKNSPLHLPTITSPADEDLELHVGWRLLFSLVYSATEITDNRPDTAISISVESDPGDLKGLWLGLKLGTPPGLDLHQEASRQDRGSTEFVREALRLLQAPPRNAAWKFTYEAHCATLYLKASKTQVRPSDNTQP